MTIDRTYRAVGAIGEYAPVKLDNNGKAVQAAPGDMALGVAQRPADAGEAVPVRMGGFTRVKAGGPINPGQLVKVGINGQVVAVGGEAAGEVVNVLGIAETAATAAGDLVEILIAHMSYKA